jgi:hypothetical protein
MHFYEHGLGPAAEVPRRRPLDPVPACRNASVSLACRDEAAPATSGAGAWCLEVDDFDRVHPSASLPPVARCWACATWARTAAVLSLRDPEGHVVQLFKRASAAKHHERPRKTCKQLLDREAIRDSLYALLPGH